MSAAEIWVSGAELRELTGWNTRTINRKCTAGTLVWQPDSEDQRARRYRLDPSLSQQFLSRHPGAIVKRDAALQTTSVKVAFTSEAEERQARERFAIIEPLLDFIRRPDLKLKDGSPVTTVARMAAYLAERHPVTDRTLWRWLDRFREGGLLALAATRRKDKGKSHFFETYPDAARMAAFVYLGQRQSVRCAYEAIERDRELLGIPVAELPHYDTVRAWLTSSNAISEPMRVLAREGRAAYQARMAPYVSRGYSDVAANQIWVSDHMIHDVEVMNDCFDDAPMGTPIRLRFTCILDFRSRYVVGVSWAWEGSSRSIGSALRWAVTNHGPAESFYADNGKDYLKVAKGALPTYLRESPQAKEDWYATEIKAIADLGVLARLGMTVQHCIVRHPQSKHVERFFRTLHERFDKKFPTYTGGSPDKRPDYTAAAMADHRKLLRMGKANESGHPRASHFIRMCLTWLDDYHARPHSGNGMDGRTPAEVFEQERSPLQRPVPEPNVLALLLAEREERMVHECSIELKKRRYIGGDDISAARLHEQNERRVLVAYDPLDLESVAVLDLDGHLICWARTEQYLRQAPDEGTNAKIAASMSQRHSLEGATRESLRNISRAAKAAGARTEVEHLAARAHLLPAAVGQLITQRGKSPKAESASAPAYVGDVADEIAELIARDRAQGD